MTLRTFPVPDLRRLHGYHTLCPCAPDASGRILIAEARLEDQTGERVPKSRKPQIYESPFPF